eukprot:6207879-Ditylum_brightwellii.AAC.1
MDNYPELYGPINQQQIQLWTNLDKEKKNFLELMDKAHLASDFGGYTISSSKAICRESENSSSKIEYQSTKLFTIKQ